MAKTSQATAGQHLLKFEKKAENAAADDFESNFSGAAFCLAQPIGGLFVIYGSGRSDSVVADF